MHVHTWKSIIGIIFLINILNKDYQLNNEGRLLRMIYIYQSQGYFSYNEQWTIIIFCKYLKNYKKLSINM